MPANVQAGARVVTSNDPSEATESPIPVSSANARTDSDAAGVEHWTASSNENAKGAMDIAVDIFIPQKRRVGSADTVAHVREAPSRNESSLRAASYSTLLWQLGPPRLRCSVTG